MKNLLFSVASLFAANSIFAVAPDTVKIWSQPIGQLELQINSDTNASGQRNNPNRVYLLHKDSIYIQQSPLVVSNLGGTLQIIGQSGGSKPVWLKVQNNGAAVGINNITSGLKLQNIQYMNTETAGVLPQTSFNLTGANSHLTVDNCLVEGCNLEWADVDGVPVGNEVRITNNYFRDFHDYSQWWAGRVVEMKVPIDTFIVENNTFTGGGLTFLSQNDLTEYAFINHNTFINNTKYPFLCQYWKECYFTNNIFVNANWVGEDSINVATGGQDPDGHVGHAMYEGIFGVDTIISGEIAINPKWYVNGTSGDLKPGLGLADLKIYAADNIVVSSASLSEYYNGDADQALVPGATVNGNAYAGPLSYLGWNSSPAYTAPFPVKNIPGIWENSRAVNLEKAYSNIKEYNNSIYTMNAATLLNTDPLPQAAADKYIKWNQVQWSVTGAALPADYTGIAFGDGDATTFPGIGSNGTASENSDGSGIKKFTDLKENFAMKTPVISDIDKMVIGAQHWVDGQVYDGVASLAAVKNAYIYGPVAISTPTTNVSEIGVYPNPAIDQLKSTKVVKSFTMYDISGRTVLKVNNASSFNVSMLPRGLYLVKADGTTTKIVLK